MLIDVSQETQTYRYLTQNLVYLIFQLNKNENVMQISMWIVDNSFCFINITCTLISMYLYVYVFNTLVENQAMDTAIQPISHFPILFI